MNFDELYSDYVATSKTKHYLNIDMTFRCPLQCPLCMRNRSGGAKKVKQSKDITVESFYKLCQEFKIIHMCGQISDPIYHPNFLELLEMARKHSSEKLSIMTNGSGKKKEWWEKAYALSDNNVYWHFALDGLTQEVANIYRINTNFNDVMNAMKLGVKLNKNIRWKFIVFKHNEHQVQDAIKYAKANKIEFHIVKSSRWDEQLIKRTGIQPPSKKYVSEASSTKTIKHKYLK